MDASVFVVMLVLSCGGLSGQFPQDATDNNIDKPMVEPPKNCTTAKNITGICLDRSSCSYSTVAIDLSLYATRQYKQLCDEKKVCCPAGYEDRREEEVPDKDINFDVDADDQNF